MPNREVNVTKRVQTAQGLRYCPVVLSANGRVKPDFVYVNGAQEKHEEGAYYLEWREGSKRIRLSVGKDAADATAKRLRKEAELKLELVLHAAERTVQAPAELVWRKLGLRLSSVNVESVARANGQLRGGMVVTEIRADGAAGKAGIQRGDILLGLHQWEMLSLDNVVFVLTHPDLATFSPVRFFIIRSGQVHRGWLQQVE